MTRGARLVSIVTVLALAVPAATVLAQGVGASPVRLTTEFRGPGMCLDVVNGGPGNNRTHLQPCGNFSGQHWIATPLGNGYSTLTTAFRGPGFCLDVVNGGPDDGQTELQPCGNCSGQNWHASAP